MQVTLGGKSAEIKGDMPKLGSDAPDITIVATDMKELSLLDDFSGKVKVLIGIPSVETSVCAMESRKFNEKINGMKDVAGIIVSKDLPFTLKKFCQTEGLENVIPASDFRYNDFCEEYGTEILSGNFKGLSARAVFVVDKQDKVRYVELVKEIGNEPNYDAIMEVVEGLV
jgi:thiol peroxidase